MEKDEKKEEKRTNKKKRSNVNVIIASITLIISIGFLTYSTLTVDSLLTNISKLMIPVFIFIISSLLFISSTKNSLKKGIFIMFSIVLVSFISFELLNDLSIINLPKDEAMISYENESYKTLSEWADKNDIELITEYEYNDEIEKGNIIRLSSTVGELVKNIKSITVTVSNGPDYDKIVVVPSMIGWDIESVVKFIEDNHIIGVDIEYITSDETKDTIINQSKNGDIRRNQEWQLTASLGNEDDISQTIKMINLKEMTAFNATLWLKRNNIKYTLEYEFSDSIDRNIVMNQNVDIDEEINTVEDSVMLTISKGQAIIVPDLLDMTVEEITDWIINNKLKVQFEEIYDEEVEIGKVISASVNKGDQIETDTLIEVTTSKGQIKMQSFSSLNEFKTWANKYSITYNLSYEYSTSVSKGSVISYSYKEGDIIDPEDIIYVKISLGQAITIPSFVGKTKTAATSLCNSLGIRCSFTTGNYTSYAENTVYAQSKSIGSKVASGASITLTLSKGVPVTKTLYIQQNWLSIGNADGTISSLRTQFSSNYPGVTFNFIKVSDNTLSSGMIAQNSPTNHGSSVTQGKTYTIYVVSN